LHLDYTKIFLDTEIQNFSEGTSTAVETWRWLLISF